MYLSQKTVQGLSKKAQNLASLLFKKNINYLDVKDFFEQTDKYMSECLFSHEQPSLLVAQCFYTHLEQAIINHILAEQYNPLELATQYSVKKIIQFNFDTSRFLSLGLVYGVLPTENDTSIAQFYRETTSENNALLKEQSKNFKYDCYWDMIQGFYFIQGNGTYVGIINYICEQQKVIQPILTSIVEKQKIEALINPIEKKQKIKI